MFEKDILNVVVVVVKVFGCDLFALMRRSTVNERTGWIESLVERRSRGEKAGFIG